MVCPEFRSTLEEVKARYRLEPSLRDVYVEGSTDCALLKWFFQHKGRHEVVVYPIDLVDVPAELLDSLRLSQNSNRSRLLALSQALFDSLDSELSVCCVADLDYSEYLGVQVENDFLLYTDYTSFEMYLFNKAHITKFVEFVLAGMPMSVELLFNELVPVLQRLFLIRLTNEYLGWGLNLIELRRYLRIENDGITFDDASYVKNILVTNGRAGSAEEFVRTLQGFETRLHNDPRHNIRGHDFTEVFFRVAKKLKQRLAPRTRRQFERALLGCIELSTVEDEPLFRRLARL